MDGRTSLPGLDRRPGRTCFGAVDGETVSQVRATHWTRVEDESDMLAGRNVRGFDFHLPQRFADVCVHKLTLRHPDGDFLPAVGTFVAFPDGLDKHF